MTRNPRGRQSPTRKLKQGNRIGRHWVVPEADTARRCTSPRTPGGPVARVVTAGQRHDSIAFDAVMANLRIERPGQGRPRTRPDPVLADKAHSSVAIRTALRARGIKATIPSKANEITGRARRGSKGGRPPAFDKAAYKTRNVVERTINKLRQTRAVATRYDKREFVYRGTIDVASIRIWLRDPPETHSRDTA